VNKVTVQLNPEEVKPAPPTLRSVPILRPVLVCSDEGQKLVMIKVPARGGEDTYLCLQDGSSPMWASTPENYKFIRYLDNDESIVIYGRGGY
jgi:hypothetical protein